MICLFNTKRWNFKARVDNKKIGLLFFLLVLAFNTAFGHSEEVLLKKKTTWLGFEKENIIFNKREAFILMPKKALAGNPWVWNAGLPDLNSSVDTILLSKGYSIVYVNTEDLNGNPIAMGIWDNFYDWLIQKKGFASKAVLEASGAEAISVYNWAIRNPSKVSCIYCVAPVCDTINWIASATDNFKTLADFKVPILQVIGLTDNVVPNDIHAFAIAHGYIRVGGKITLFPDIIKAEQLKNDHRFSIKNPQKIADFIFDQSFPVKTTLDPALYHENRGGLTNCYLRFTRDKVGKVVFLGGSITEMNGWRDKVCRYLTEHFPETRFEFINAGISSTGSTLGAFRLATDVLAKGDVDLLFEEASVNDSGLDSMTCIRGMEGIVYKALKTNPYTDIVLMYFVDPSKIQDYNSGKTPAVINIHNKVAVHYNLPSINLARGITDRINNGELTWDEDFVNLHPAPLGHELYFQSIRSLFDDCWKSAGNFNEKKQHILPDLLDKYSFKNGVYEDIHKATPGNGWSVNECWNPSGHLETRKGFVNVPVMISDQPGSIVEFSFEGTAIGMSGTSGPDAGIIDYSIDGAPFKSFDLYTYWSGFLYLPWYVVLDGELSSSKHQIKIRISENKNEKSIGHACRIVHFLVNK